MRRDRRQWLVSDFETATDDPNRTYVWAWAVCDPMADWHVDMGTSIRTWLDYVADHPAIYYFHNLAFDGSFILDYILKNDFTFLLENDYVIKADAFGIWVFQKNLLENEVQK